VKLSRSPRRVVGYPGRVSRQGKHGCPGRNGF
jgi:hypothetical protein